MAKGLYEELFERVACAQDELLKHAVIANTVVINGKKYARLAYETKMTNFGFRPSIFGLAIEAADLPDDWDFIVQQRSYPPMSYFEAMEKENKELKAKLSRLKDIINNGEEG